MVAGDHQRAATPEARGDPLRDDRVARDHPQHRPSWRAASSQPGSSSRVIPPRRHRREQRQSGRRGGLDGLGDRARAERADHRARPGVGRRSHRGPDGVGVAVGDWGTPEALSTWSTASVRRAGGSSGRPWPPDRPQPAQASRSGSGSIGLESLLEYQPSGQISKCRCGPSEAGGADRAEPLPGGHAVALLDRNRAGQRCMNT